MPESEVASSIIDEAIRRAEKNFHDVYKPGRRCDVNNSEESGNAADPNSTEAIPVFQLRRDAARRVISNPLRSRDAVAGHPSGNLHRGSDSQDMNDDNDANKANEKLAGSMRYSRVYRRWVRDSWC